MNILRMVTGVLQEIKQGLFSSGVTAYAATATIPASVVGKLLTFNHATVAGTLTLPTLASTVEGDIISISNLNTAICTVARASTDTIDAKGQIGSTSLPLYKGDSIVLVRGVSSWQQLSFSMFNTFNNSITAYGVVLATGGLIGGSTGTPRYTAVVQQGIAPITDKKLIDISFTDVAYSTAAFKITITDPNSNNGSTGVATSTEEQVYYLTCERNAAAVLGLDGGAIVTGPLSLIKVVKTAVGVFEVQFTPDSQYREYLVDMQLYAWEAGLTYVFHSGSSVGSVGITTYSATVSGAVDHFQNVNIGRNLLLNNAAGTSGFVPVSKGAGIATAWEQRVDLASNQTIGGIKTFTSNMLVNNADPAYTLVESDQAVDAKVTRMNVFNGNFIIQSLTDAYTFIANLFSIDRSGNATITGWVKTNAAQDTSINALTRKDYVDSLIGGGGGSGINVAGISLYGTNTTLTLADEGKLIFGDTNATVPYTLTLPAIATTTDNASYIFFNPGKTTMTIKGNALENIVANGLSANTIPLDSGESLVIGDFGGDWREITASVLNIEKQKIQSSLYNPSFTTIVDSVISQVDSNYTPTITRVTRGVPAVESTYRQSLQPLIDNGSICMASANAGLTTTSVYGMALTVAGTATAATPSGGYGVGALPRLRLVAASAATAVASFRDAVAKLIYMGRVAGQRPIGFHVSMIAGITSGNTVNKRFFMGIRALTTAPTDVNPSTLLNMIGFGWDAADGFGYIMSNNGAGAATKHEISPIAKTITNDTQTYKVEITYISLLESGTNLGGFLIVVYIKETSEANFKYLCKYTIYTSNAKLPAAGYLAPFAYCSAGGVAAAMGINFISLYQDCNLSAKSIAP